MTKTIPSIGLVAANQRWATETADRMGPHVRALWPGCSIVGEGYDLIILHGWNPNIAFTEKAKAAQLAWYQNQLRTRLNEGGSIVYSISIGVIEGPKDRK